MSIADTCEESAFEHGRSMALESFTKKELVEELCKREGVINKYVIPVGDYAYIAHGKKPSIKVDGAATIFVIK